MSAPIVVAGAGIAGSALALGLHRAGIDVVVCEAHPDDGGDAGAFLALASNGVRALRVLGAEEAVAAASEPLGSLRMLDAAGAPLADRRLGDPAYRLLTRAALARSLSRLATARGIDVRYGTAVVGASPAPDGVDVRLSDGAELHGALLVGADGLHSPVRALIDPSTPPPRPVGQRIYYGYSPGHLFPDVGDFHVLRTGTAAFGAIPTADGSTWWFARADIPTPPPPPDRDPAAALLEILEPDGPPARAVRSAGTVVSFDAHDLPHVGPWFSDRMLVIGDAAHAASPATGQGASMALEDAVVLTKVLREARPLGDPAVVAARYERLRRGRTQANILASAAMSRPDRPVEGADPGAPQSDDEVRAHLDWSRPLP